MGPTWALSVPDGPYVGPMNLAIRVFIVAAGYGWPFSETSYQDSEGRIFIMRTDA